MDSYSWRGVCTCMLTPVVLGVSVCSLVHVLFNVVMASAGKSLIALFVRF